eukprot:TRINITY_DN25417_c0_g1_i1.p1 TRINITY_DN25417_c0_g1~~TRINITY_DN25417_c0_g1_i1.p1  ORF type:complete len:367 (+),score=64.41 TRINITY_DN25417_c0_g1_i1:569-1669(+)
MHSSAPLRFPAPRGLPRSKLDTPPLPPQRPRQRPSPCPPRSQRPPLPPKALRRPRRSPPQGPAPRKQQELSSSSGVQVSALSQPQREGVKTKMQLERGSAPSACPTQGGASGGSGGGRAASSGRSSGECSTAHHTKRQLGQAFHRHARRGRASSLDIMGILAELGYSAAPEGIELLLWAVRSSDEEALSLREVRRLLHEGVVTQVIRPAAHGRSGDGEKKARSAVQWVVAQRPAPGSERSAPRAASATEPARPAQRQRQQRKRTGRHPPVASLATRGSDSGLSGAAAAPPQRSRLWRSPQQTPLPSTPTAPRSPDAPPRPASTTGSTRCETSAASAAEWTPAGSTVGPKADLRIKTGRKETPLHAL